MVLSRYKKNSALFKGITSNHDWDFYCSNYLHSFRIENKLKNYEKVRKNRDYWYTEMPKENSKILKCNHGQKSMKIQSMINADMKCLLERIDTCHNNPKKSSTTKTVKHLASGYSFLTYCTINATKNNLDYYRDKHCMKNFVRI